MSRIIANLINVNTKRSLSVKKGSHFQQAQHTVKDADKVDYTVSEIRIPVPGGEIAGKLWELPGSTIKNPKTPPVICMHGWQDNAGAFDILLPLIFANNKNKTSSTFPTTFLALDLPGHGLTTYYSQWFNDCYIDGVIAVQRVLRHYNWNKVSLVGQSIGSQVGFVFNGLFPKLVHKYVALEVIRPIPIESPIDLMSLSVNTVLDLEEWATRPKKAVEFEELVKKFYDARYGEISMDGCRLLMQRGARHVDRNGKLFEFAMNFRLKNAGSVLGLGRFSKQISAELAERIISPICFIQADPGIDVEPKEEYDEFCNIFERNLGPEKFERHLVPGNHNFHINNPESFAPIISKFL